MRQSFPSLAIQSVAHGPTASASPGSLSKTQNLRAPCSRPMESESDTYWTRPPRSVCVTMKVLGARLQHSGAMAFPSFTSANREALSSHLRVLERSSGVFLCVYMRERQTETEVDRERAWDEHTWAWSIIWGITSSASASDTINCFFSYELILSIILLCWHYWFAG